MSAQPHSTTPKNLLPVEVISTWVYQQILRLQQQQPDWLLAKYRMLSWQSDRYRENFVTKLATELSKATNPDELVDRLEQVLQKLLVDEFFESSNFAQWREVITQTLGQETQPTFSKLKQANNSQTTEYQKWEHSQNGSSPQAIALLLLDAENLQLEIAAEKLLAKVCQYPIQIKIAFANWRNLGKQDLELHERGYDLIHVPAGRDNADGKMIAVGSAIREHYPTVKAVLVCSSDKVMTNLCNKLQQQGITVYLVKKQKDVITVHDSETAITQTLSLKPEPEVPSLEQCIAQIKALIQAEQKATSTYWVKLSKLSEAFRKQAQITISQVVSKYYPGKRARDFFVDNPTHFVVHQVSSEAELYVTLFVPPEFESQATSPVNQPVEILQEQSDSSFQSATDLEKTLSKIITDLSKTTADGYVPIAIAATQFCQQFGQPITQVIKDLKLAGNFIKFVRTCSNLKLKQVNKSYYVAVQGNQEK